MTPRCTSSDLRIVRLAQISRPQPRRTGFWGENNGEKRGHARMWSVGQEEEGSVARSKGERNGDVPVGEGNLFPSWSWGKMDQTSMTGRLGLRPLDPAALIFRRGATQRFPYVRSRARVLRNLFYSPDPRDRAMKRAIAGDYCSPVHRAAPILFSAESLSTAT